MIARLFGYDFRALSRSLLPIHAVILIVVFAGILFIGWWYHYSDNPSLWTTSSLGAQEGEAVIATRHPTDLYRFFSMVYTIVLFLCVFVCIGGLVSTFVVGINRFYTNLFTDEGQLTLTLPLRTTQILLSKVLAVLLWVLIDILVLMLCYLLLVFGKNGFEPINIITNNLTFFFGVLGSLVAGSSLEYSSSSEYFFFPYQLLGFTQVLISIMSSMLLAFLAFTLGAAMANRHRVAAGLAWYIGLSWFIFFFISVAGFIGTSYVSQSSSFFLSAFLENFFSVGLFVNCLVIVVSFALTVYLLAHKVDAKG